MYLKDKLNQYAKEDYYPFHMPGHKRNIQLTGFFNPYEIDITEIDGMDNMHDAKGVIKNSMERAARLYQSEHTYFLINGSTSGNLIGICASTKKGDKILIARNCHKSAYQAIFLNELNPVYLYPQFNQKKGIQCGYTAAYIEEMLIKHPDVKLVMLVSPTYEGVISEIDKIAEIVHKRGIPLMVDEAHGAHFGFCEGFPKSSVQQGADIVVHSVHKTLPAFTQTALLHINGSLVDAEKIKYYYSVFQSSSPSYIFMCGIDHCMELIENRGDELFENLKDMLDAFYKKTEQLQHIQVLQPEAGRDCSKLVISTRNTNMTGPQLYDILLERYKLQMEMVAKDYVLGIASIGDTREGFKRLEKALFEIDKMAEIRESVDNKADINYESVQNETIMNSYEVLHQSRHEILFAESEGQTAGAFVNVYPPGIPLLAPGERISALVIRKIESYLKAGLEIQGLRDKKFISIVNREG